MRGEDEARAVTQSVLDAGQSFADAGVVHDAAVVERDVEVDAHEDAVIVERKIADRKFGHGNPVVGRWSLVVWHCCRSLVPRFAWHTLATVANGDTTPTTTD